MGAHIVTPSIQRSVTSMSISGEEYGKATMMAAEKMKLRKMVHFLPISS